MDQNDIENSLLILDEKLLKSSKKSLRISFFLMSLSAFLTVTYSYICINYYIDNIFNFSFWANLACLFMWIFQFGLNIKTYKNSKINVKNFTKKYYSQLKKVNYPKYIKEQRIKKLKKLKIF